jgi:hypothetical protein
MDAPIDADTAPARRWDDVPARRIAEGIERQMIVGEVVLIDIFTPIREDFPAP